MTRHRHHRRTNGQPPPRRPTPPLPLFDQAMADGLGDGHAATIGVVIDVPDLAVLSRAELEHPDNLRRIGDHIRRLYELHHRVLAGRRPVSLTKLTVTAGDEAHQVLDRADEAGDEVAYGSTPETRAEVRAAVTARTAVVIAIHTAAEGSPLPTYHEATAADLGAGTDVSAGLVIDAELAALPSHDLNTNPHAAHILREYLAEALRRHYGDMTAAGRRPVSTTHVTFLTGADALAFLDAVDADATLDPTIEVTGGAADVDARLTLADRTGLLVTLATVTEDTP